MAYVSNESGQFQVYVRRYPDARLVRGVEPRNHLTDGVNGVCSYRCPSAAIQMYATLHTDGQSGGAA